MFLMSFFFYHMKEIFVYAQTRDVAQKAWFCAMGPRSDQQIRAGDVEDTAQHPESSLRDGECEQTNMIFHVI